MQDDQRDFTIVTSTRMRHTAALGHGTVSQGGPHLSGDKSHVGIAGVTLHSHVH